MEPHDTPEANQASGNSIFWALTALALNTMMEPSRFRSLEAFDKNSGATTISTPDFEPFRSSPVLCAAEAILDMVFAIFPPRPQKNTLPTPEVPNAAQHQSPSGEQNADEPSDHALATSRHPGPSTDNAALSKATLKVVAFLLGVLPQAIKLFSMRGIVGTQICAAMFLAASVAKSVSGNSPSHFVASVQVVKESAAYLFLVLVTYIAHIIFYFWLYFNIAARLLVISATADASDSDNIPSSILKYVKFVYSLFILLTIVLNLAWRRCLTWEKWSPVIAFVLLPKLDHQPQRPGSHIPPPPKWMNSFSLAVSLLIWGFFVCLQVSTLCIFCGRFISRLAVERSEPFDGYSQHSTLPTTSPAADAEPEPTLRSRVADGYWRGIGWLKAILGSLFKALDNHGEWLGTFRQVSIEHWVLASGIFNLFSGLMYYLVAFDPTGTSSPSWNSVLG